MSQIKIEIAAREVEKNHQRFDRALTDLSDSLEIKSRQAGEFVGRAQHVLSDPKQIVTDYVTQQRPAVENYVKESAEVIKNGLNDFLNQSIEDLGEKAQRVGDQVIDHVEERIVDFVQSIRSAADEGLQLRDERPLLFMGLLFGIGFLGGLVLTRQSGIAKFGIEPEMAKNKAA